MSETELIVFVDETGKPTGETGPKLASHNDHTKLHLAFSCYIFRQTGSSTVQSNDYLLVTQRAHSKKVWPGVWTNSVCGHPMPGESIEDAIRRRAQYELGIDSLEDIKVVLPTYRYTTPPFNGIIENEFCPVYMAYTTQEAQPNPEEVEAYEWMAWSDWAAFITAKPDEVSYWAKDQYQQMDRQHPFAAR
jgi:isopentenyl-diphosphate Delta-isomerase